MKMCLTVMRHESEREIEKIKERAKAEGVKFAEAWKVVRVTKRLYRVRGRVVEKRELRSTIYSYTWRPGWHRSRVTVVDRSLYGGLVPDTSVSCGLHFYVNRRDAEDLYKSGFDEVVLRVLVPINAIAFVLRNPPTRPEV